MEIKINEVDGTTILSLIGRLDTNTSPDLEKCAGELFESGKNDIAVDMEACEFVSSAGLRVIVAMQKRLVNNGKLVFRNVRPEVMDVFEMTGFSKILTFE